MEKFQVEKTFPYFDYPTFAIIDTDTDEYCVWEINDNIMKMFFEDRDEAERYCRAMNNRQDPF